MAASSYLNRIPIKKLTIAATPPALPTHGFLGLILLYTIFEWGRKFLNILTSHSSLDSKTSFRDSELHQEFSGSREDKEEDDVSISRDDVETVFAKLGIFCHPEAEKLQERFCSKDFSGLFGEEEEEEEIDVEEVRAAFNVFDENRDGFIDEKELQRVLCALDLKEGLELENCRKMIKAFDENGDGRIDFSEFCKLFAHQ